MPPKPKRRSARRAQEADHLDWLLLPYDVGKALLASAWRSLRSQRSAQLLLLLVLVAAFLRLMRPDWYSSRTFHPDERWIFDKTSQLSYPGEPGKDDSAGLQYGSLPFYAVAAVKDVAHGVFKQGQYEASITAGRTLTGLVDSLTVLATYFLALPLGGAAVALLAALLVAMAPLHIQLAHFFTVDPWLACFATFTLAACVRVARKPGYGSSALAGVLYAAALASKSSGLPLALPIALAHLWPALAPGLADKERRNRLAASARCLGVAAAASVVAFFIFMPWALLHFSKFLQNQTAQRDILVTGSPGGVPFVRQYWDTNFLFHLKNIAVFYLGLPTGLLALLAVPFALFQGARAVAAAWAPAPKPLRAKPGAPKPASADGWWQAAFTPALLLSWVLPYFAIVGFSFAKFARYMLPLLPALCVLLVLSLLWVRSRSARAYKALVVALVLAALAHGLGYGATYLRQHPWLAASAWTFENVPPNVKGEGEALRPTRVLNEDWGDDLPVDVDGQNAGRYQGLKGRFDQVNIVEWDSANKLARLSRSLSQADVLYLADARAYGTYLRLPTRFPLTHSYYDLLFSDPGRLGFELAHESSNPIRLFGFGPALPDSRIPSVPRWLWADESFTLYDRPHAFVFRRVKPMSEAEVEQVLRARVNELGLSQAFMQGVGPEELHKQAKGGGGAVAEQRVNPNFGRSRGALRPLVNPVLAWWVLSLALGLLALPLCVLAFGRYPDGGYALSKALGLFLFGWLAYNLSWLKALPFTQAGLWALLGALAVGAVLALRRRQGEAKAWFRRHKADILFTEALFAAAFLFFVLVRAYNPNIHDITGQGYFGGGEPLGMTYLSALTRCSTFPAFDPWLTLHDSSYYYFGHVLAAAMTKLSGFEPAVTYNLSLALFFALTLVSAFGVLRALVPSRKASLAGAAMVGLAGSLWSLGYLGIQANRGSGLFSAWFSHGFIWDPTRFPELVNGHIFEFPYFSFLYSDLHPHSMVLPFSLVLLGLLLVPFLSLKAGWRSVGEGPLQAGLWLGLMALLLDAQYALNSWSWPVFVALSLGALLVGPWAGKGLGWWRSSVAAAQGLALGMAALVLGRLAMTGFRRYFIQDGGNRLGTVVPSEWQMSAYIPMAYYFAGLLALALLGGRTLGAWGATQGKALGMEKLRRRAWWDRALSFVERLWEKKPAFSVLAGLSLLLSGALLAWALAHHQTQGVLSLSLGLGLACVALFALFGGHRDGRHAFLWMLGAFSFFLVAGSERWFVSDRMNTIFKFWFNGWVFSGVIFGAAWAWVPRAEAPSKAGRRQPRIPLAKALPWIAGLGMALGLYALARMDAAHMARGGRFIFSLLGLGAIALAVLWAAAARQGAAWFGPALKGVLAACLGLGLLYPVGATVARIQNTSQFKDPHLDGLRFMAERQARDGGGAQDYDSHDHALIRWLNANADVTETLLEAPGLDLYKGYSRFAIYTGLPTFLGWDYQVGQQLGERAGNLLAQRKEDAQAIYNGGDEAALALLKQYKVRWIVVGTIERRLYSAEGLAKFERLAERVAEDGPSRLYRFHWDR